MTSVADVGRGIVHATVELAAPPEVVFDALTEPAQLGAWWGGEAYRTRDWKVDPRPGGAWSAVADGPGGATTVSGEYLEFERPRRLVYTWLASWDGHQRTVVAIELAPTATGTRLALRHEGFAGRPDSCRDHGQGWGMVLGWLAAR